MKKDADVDIGFIGLGVMGGSMCRNVALKHDKQVFAFDVNDAAFSILDGTKAQRLNSIQEIAQKSDLILFSLPGSKQVEEVVSVIINTDNKKVKTIVDLSTTTVATARSSEKNLKDIGIDFIDAPVARTREAARKGLLSIMVGTDKDTFDFVEPFLRYMGSDVTLCGGVGCGQAVKLINNALVFEHTVALAEMMVIGERTGVEPQVLLDALSKGSGNSFVLENHGRKALLPREFPPKSFPPEYVVKDLSYVLELAEDSNVNALVTNLAKRYYDLALENGLGGKYFPIVIELIDQDKIPKHDS